MHSIVPLKNQNDLIAVVGKWIQQKLTHEIQAAKFVTVLC